MRKVKSGLIEWGPVQKECTFCKDVWEIEKEDLAFWQIKEGQWNPYNKQVAGFICPTCHTKNRINELDNRATLLYNEAVRRVTDKTPTGRYWEYR